MGGGGGGRERVSRTGPQLDPDSTGPSVLVGVGIDYPCEEGGGEGEGDKLT